VTRSSPPAADDPLGGGPPTEAEFFSRAREFFAKLGVNATDIDPDLDLLERELLDSLLLLAFLSFIEEQRGGEAELQPQDIHAVRTLRTAYELVCSGVSSR
jgi:hypothetical protein